MHTHALYTLHPHFDRFGPRLEKDLDAATNNARADSASWLPWVHQASRSAGETNLGGDEDHPGFFKGLHRTPIGTP